MTFPSQSFHSRLRRIALIYGPFANVYSYSIADLMGQLGAYNHLALMNPADSNRSVIGISARIHGHTSGIATTPASMRAHRITDATGGTLIPNSDIMKNDPSEVDSVTVVRTGNPSVSGLGAQVLAAAPPTQPGGSQDKLAPFEFTASPGRFLIPMGHGLVFATTDGDVNQHWNIHVTWIEYTLST